MCLHHITKRCMKKMNEKYNFDNVHWYNMSLKQYVYFFYYCLEVLDMFFGIDINARCNSVWSICASLL